VNRLAGGSALATIAAMVVIACSSFNEPSAADADGGTTEAGVDAAQCAPPSPSACANAVLHVIDFASTAFPPPDFAPESLNGTVERIETGSGCTPGAMRAATTVPGVPDSTADAEIVRKVTGTFSTGRLAFSFRPPTPVEKAFVNFGCAVEVRPAATSKIRAATRLSLAGSRFVLGGTVRDASDVLVPNLPEIELDNFLSESEAATWHTLDAKLTLTKTTLTVDATVDGKKLAPYDLPILEPTGRVSIDCGIIFADEESVSQTVEIDDVLVELCP
jgi:hypothetical protein